MSNGLDDLANRRRRGRQTPPPKHPRSEQEQSEQPATEENAAPPSEPAADSTQEAPLPPEPHPDPGPAAAELAAPRRSDAARSERRPSIEAYLDEDLMDQMWDVEAAGVARRERHLQSPVVRLALRELFGRYTPEQIVDQVLAASPPKTGKQGRPRR